MEPEEIKDNFRMIISHALLGYEDNVSKEDWNLVFDECTKFVTENFTPKNILELTQ